MRVSFSSIHLAVSLFSLRIGEETFEISRRTSVLHLSHSHQNERESERKQSRNNRILASKSARPDGRTDSSLFVLGQEEEEEEEEDEKERV